MTTAAEERLATIRSLSLIQRRIQFLDAACASATALSIGMVSTALGSEPELNRSKLLPNTRLLLEDAARQQLYAQFDALRRGIGVENKDLRVPAVVWLTALYQYGTSGVGSL